MPDTLKPRPPDMSQAGMDIRAMRLFIVVALISTAVLTLRHLLNAEIFEKNKLEVGLILGWLIAKSGTVIDWLFGGSESGTRRADIVANQVQPPAPPDAEPIDVNVANPPSKPAHVKETK